MIRVAYEWRVRDDVIPQFKSAWGKTTTTIRESTDGARGSVLLQSQQDPNVFTSIARWDSYAHWEAFWKDENRTEMKEMHSLAERLSVNTYEEIGDYTV